MPKQFDETNRGVLFNNRDRKSSEKDRDYGGKVNVVCPACAAASEHWLSGWIKTSKKGLKFLSLSLQAVESQRTEGERPTLRDELSDEVRF